MSSTCKRCGARFGVPGAVGDLAGHMASFHPTAGTAQVSAGAAAVSTGGGGSTGEGKRLDRMNTAELEALAAAEGVDLGDASTNRERAAAITDAREASS